jgi:hypothetical protein
MQPKSMRRHLMICGISGALIATPAQAGEGSRDQMRAGLDALSHEMSTCAAYFSLLSAIIESADGADARVETARRIKSTGQAMLVQSINVANRIGMADDAVMERMQAALKQMVDTINGDPPNSLAAMYGQYGRPCDELLATAPSRLAELIARDGQDF